MKHPLPTTRQGEVALGGVILPPGADDAEPQAPSAAHPGGRAAAPKAALIAASANGPAPAGGAIAGPPSSTASAANPGPSRAAPDANRRTQPRAVVCGTPARSAAGRTPHAPPATCAITEPIVSAASSRQASTNAGSSA